MNTKNLVAASVLAALSGLALADGATATNISFNSALSRAQVQSDVLQARAAGQLVPAGQGPSFVVPARSTARRADVQAEVLQARASGELTPAGEGPNVEAPFVSTLARADVKYAVLQARAAGQLIPAGEGPNVDGASRRSLPTQPAGRFAAWFHAHTTSATN
jgi:hypothetical protein